MTEKQETQNEAKKTFATVEVTVRNPRRLSLRTELSTFEVNNIEGGCFLEVNNSVSVIFDDNTVYNFTLSALVESILKQHQWRSMSDDEKIAMYEDEKESK